MPQRGAAGSVLSAARSKLRAHAEPARASVLQRFFRTKRGGYGEGDRFLGLTVPTVRRIAREHLNLSLAELSTLVKSQFHEERLLALVVVVERARRANEKEHRALVRWYWKHMNRINNWDLVDVSAPQVLGPYFAHRSRAPLHTLARSRSVWRRRIAVLTTQHLIRSGEHGETLALACLLLKDEHDLIHKAVGWMLREVGLRDSAALERFLDKHAAEMPRTMLRYAVERQGEAQRRRHMEARARAASSRPGS